MLELGKTQILDIFRKTIGCIIKHVTLKMFKHYKNLIVVPLIFCNYVSLLNAR